MPDRHADFIQVLRSSGMEPQKAVRDEQHLTCGKCGDESINFRDERSYQDHLATKHGESPNVAAGDREKMGSFGPAQNSTPPNSSTKPSPRWSLGAQGLPKDSSVRGDAGSSPSRSSMSDDGRRRFTPSSKRPRDEGFPGRRNSRARTGSAKKPPVRRVPSGRGGRAVPPGHVNDGPKSHAPASQLQGPKTPHASVSTPDHPMEDPSGPPAGGVGPRPPSTHSSADGISSNAPPSSPQDPGNTSRRQAPAAAKSYRASIPRPKTNSLWPELVLQPESRVISQAQLAAEVKSIYIGLTMVETKCIHIDKAQAATPRGQSNISKEHWQAMIALHRTLLHEHHDFFLASQHPVASQALKKLATKYSMPARMWKHGIHSFLELLRHRLPESLEYMLAFLYLSYQMLALLYETVGSFRTTWVECLGDLGRYRMAIEDENIRDRDIWAGVARSWYNKAADTGPAVGRLWHHLAILARPHMAQQLYLYNRSLTSIIPFMNARESIVTIFDPILVATPTVKISRVDLCFLKIHALLFKKADLYQVKALANEYLDLLSPSVADAGVDWRHSGVHTVITIVGAIYGFGDQTNPFRVHSDNFRKRLQLEDPSLILPGLPEDQSLQELGSLPPRDELGQSAVQLASDLFVSTFRVILSRKGDKNTLPFLNVALTFIADLYDNGAPANTHNNAVLMQIYEQDWHELAVFLNAMLRSEENIDSTFSKSISFNKDIHVLPEDWMLRGLAWTFNFFPSTWFDRAAETEEEERYSEGLTSTMKARLDRTLSLAAHLANNAGSGLQFDSSTMRFSVSGFDTEVRGIGVGVVQEDSREMQEAKQNDELARIPFQQYAAEKLGRKYSYIIADIDVLSDTKLFEAVRKLELPVVIPEEAITELLLLEKARDVGSNEAAAAVSNIRSAIHDFRSNLRIEARKGKDVTAKYVESPHAFVVIESRPTQEWVLRQSIEVATPLGENIAEITRRGTEMTTDSRRTDTSFWSQVSRQSTATDMTMDDDDGDEEMSDTITAPSKAAQYAKPLLVSDNKAFRKHASDLGAAAYSAWILRRWIVKTQKHSATPSPKGDPVDTAMDVDVPTVAVKPPMCSE